MKSERILVIGEGAWGSALASELCTNHQVVLWCQRPEIAQEITQSSTNTRYLPGMALDNRIIPTTDLGNAIATSNRIVITTPVLYLRATLFPHAHLLAGKTIIIGCKGLEKDGALTPAEVVRDLAENKDLPLVTLAGGSFARELIAHTPTNLVFASKNSHACTYAAQLFRSSTTVCDETDDEIGVALCAALKNVYAIGGGVLTALGTGENTHAFYCVRVLRELKDLLAAAGGSIDTLLGSAGIGDLILTSLALESKNRTYGYLRGNGKPHSAWEHSGRPYPEGVNTLSALEALQRRYSIQLPIAQALYGITYGDAPPDMLVRALLGESE